MKDKLILVPVKEPKEGMKIVATDNSEGIHRDIGIIQGTDKDYKDCWMVDFGNNLILTYALSELQQIAVEYEIVKGSTNPDSLSPNAKYHKILLSPDDCEKALPLIGQEVEWEKARGKQIMFTDQQQWQEMSSAEKADYFEWVAKLITPSPIVYTEEEVREIAYNAWGYTNIHDGFDKFWDKHKKK